jgi:hypothetical protein
MGTAIMMGMIDRISKVESRRSTTLVDRERKRVGRYIDKKQTCRFPETAPSP